MSTRFPGTLSCVVIVLALTSASRGQGGLSPEILLEETGFEPTIATNGSGVVVVAWLDQNWPGTAKDIERRRSGDRGLSWGLAGPQVSDGGALDPTVATNPANGDVYFGWQTGSVNGSQFKFRRSPDGSDLSVPSQLVASSGNSQGIDRPWLTASGPSVYSNWYAKPDLLLRFKRGVV
ncbi:MAG: exo-alpha-sialidase [Phycisphaerales bacterium]|nr:exo-alpha-sialidase [Phycisphaerales bacterium]